MWKKVWETMLRDKRICENWRGSGSKLKKSRCLSEQSIMVDRERKKMKEECFKLHKHTNDCMYQALKDNKTCLYLNKPKKIIKNG